MDFLRAGHLLEGIRDDLQSGAFLDAKEKLAEMKLGLRRPGKKKEDAPADKDSPEALGGFLHRNFGHKKLPHDRVMRIAMKSHGASQETARRAADHYVAMNRGVKGEPEKEPVVAAAPVSRQY